MSDDGFLLDANVLIALSVREHVHHHAARTWLGSLDKSAAWWTTPVTEVALVRLLLNPSVTGQLLEGYQALAVLGQIHAQPDHRFLADSASFAQTAVALDGLSSSKQVTDLHLVNLAAKSALTFVTFDARLVRSLAPDDRARVLVLSA